MLLQERVVGEIRHVDDTGGDEARPEPILEVLTTDDFAQSAVLLSPDLIGTGAAVLEEVGGTLRSTLAAGGVDVGSAALSLRGAATGRSANTTSE